MCVPRQMCIKWTHNDEVVPSNHVSHLKLFNGLFFFRNWQYTLNFGSYWSNVVKFYQFLRLLVKALWHSFTIDSWHLLCADRQINLSMLSSSPSPSTVPVRLLTVTCVAVNNSVTFQHLPVQLWPLDVYFL